MLLMCLSSMYRRFSHRVTMNSPFLAPYLLCCPYGEVAMALLPQQVRRERGLYHHDGEENAWPPSASRITRAVMISYEIVADSCGRTKSQHKPLEQAMKHAATR